MVDTSSATRQKQIEKIVNDKSLTEEEKEDCIKYLLFPSPVESSQPEEVVVRELYYDNFILIDKVNSDTVFCQSETEVLTYLSEKDITVDDIVVYRKQTLRLSFENSY